MSDSEVLSILKEISRRTGGKIWVARRMGRRVSYIEGLKAGKELYAPAEILLDDGEYVIFGEGMKRSEWLDERLEKIVKILRKGVRI